MPLHPAAASSRAIRRARQLRPFLTDLEHRIVLSYTFSDIGGITLNTSGDVFVSYNSTSESTGAQQSVAELNSSGRLVNTQVFSTTESSAAPGTLTTVGTLPSLPGITSASQILELQPDGELDFFDPGTQSSTSPVYDNLANYVPDASNVYDVQTGGFTDLSGDISLANATFGDFGVDGSSLVVSAESNNWDFVMRVTYASQGSGTATVLVASPASDGLTASPGGVAVDPQGTVLATFPYQQSSASTAIHVPVGFNLFYDQDSDGLQPFIPTLGLNSLADIDSSGITVDSQDNFILALKTSALYGGGPGVAHINSTLTAFLADPTSPTDAIPVGIAYEDVDGTNELGLADTTSGEGTYTIAGELPLFSGQVTPDQLRQAYGVNQITFTGPNGSTVAGTGAGQTIAIVEEGVDPTLGADLDTFDQFFGIPNPPSFQVIDQNGVTTQNLSIVGEASLDVEWAHAIAPDASIIVYNAAYEPNNATASYVNLIDAMHEASLLPGVSVVTLSYGEAEYGLTESGINESSLDSNFTTPGVTFLAASGDSGAYGNGGYEVAVNYPAASPDVISVGGTSIDIDGAGDYPGTGSTGEVGWGYGINSGSEGGSGGGLSDVEAEPAWQTAVVSTAIDPTGARAVPDVAMDSGVAQEYDVFTSTLSGSSDSASAVGWLGDAGTSAASPIWAGLIAIADQGRELQGGTPLTGYSQTLPALYSLPGADFNDIVYGNNGYAAGPGYDLVTGLGTPVANLLVPALASYQLASQMTITTGPPSTVGANETFGLQVQVENSEGSAVTGGTVTIALGTNPDDATLSGDLTAAIDNGIATFSGLSLNQPGTGYTLVATVTGTTISQTTNPITVTTAPNSTQVDAAASPTTLTFGQAVTLTATVSVISPGTGVPIGTVTFEDGATTIGTAELNSDGVASLTFTPPAAGTASIKVAFSGDVNDQPSTTTLDLTIARATPTLTWSDPANITAGTALGSTQLDATASFDGAFLPGLFVYTPAAGTVLPVGNGQTLLVTFQPTDATDFQSVTASVPINVTPQTPVAIVSEQPIFKRKTNKKGKPVGKPVLVGFSFSFDEPLGTAAANSANYKVDSVATQVVKKKTERILARIANVSVNYNPASDEATILFKASETFPKGGQITVLSSVTADTTDVLVGPTVFTISKGGKHIEPQ